ncbi:MAG: glycogen/starch synthase, partial [Armatimonadota bacterium]|nr:glycogen/starch synthase [Armatimonadota bacterium]
MDSPGLKILLTASECTPYAKTGGLADVVAGLAKSLRALGHDARVVIPLYASIDRLRFNISFQQTSCVHMGNGEESWIGIYHAMLHEDVPIYFVEHNRFFGRPGIYNDPAGDYGDNAFRFALLSKASMQICKDLNFIPDVIHVHDWPTALVSAYLKTWDRILSPLSTTASVLTIHNIGYAGVYHASVL